MKILNFIVSIAAILVTSVYAQDTAKLKVGDSVESTDRTDGQNRAIVKEIGTASKSNCYLLVFPNDPSDKKGEGYWVCTFGLTGKIFLLDNSGRRVGDINEPNFKRIETKNVLPKTPVTDSSSFMPGDRVEVLSGGTWYPGTVTRGLENNAYRVAMDKDVDKGLPDYGATPNMIRSLSDGSIAPKASSIPPMRKAIKCPVQGKTSTGAPPTQLIRQLIQCLWEDNGDERSVVNFDIQSLEIGKPRRWVVGSDMGTGNPNTLVYPVTGRWIWKTYSLDGSSVVIAEQTGAHNCYINAGQKWQCGRDSSKDLKPVQRINRN